MDWEALLAGLNPIGSARAAGLGGGNFGGEPMLRPGVPLDQAPLGSIPPIAPQLPPRAANDPLTANEPLPLGASLQGPELGMWGPDQGPGLPGVGGPVAAPPSPPAVGVPATPSMPVSLAPPSPGAGVPAQAAALQNAARGNNPTSQLLAALRGVQAPAAPVAQKVSTPSLPAVRPVAAPKLLDVLSAMGLGRAPNPVARMPMTLGQALAGR